MKKTESWEDYVCRCFPISNEEYEELEKEFGKLTKHEAWELIRKNTKNNYTDDFDDINQKLTMSMLRAGSYTKRQNYIEQCLTAAKTYANDRFIKFVLQELESLWSNRKRHGASRQKFGMFQEQLLEQIVTKLVPTNHKPTKNQPLKIDSAFAAYCKAVTWNAQKNIGRKITKEKVIRTGLASLSDYEHLACI